MASPDNEDLRVQFAEKANAVGAYIEEKSQVVAEMAIGGQALEDTIQQLRALYAEVEAYQPTFDEVEAVHQV